MKTSIIDNYNLSIIMPYFKKYHEFKKTIKINSKYFQRNGIELIIVLDEPTEKYKLLELIKKYPFINWKIIVNEKDHIWRNPSKAINVGIRHSNKKYIMIMSPESEFYNDVISILRNRIEYNENNYIIGSVIFANINEIIDQHRIGEYSSFPYGSIMTSRKILIDIGGYSEKYVEWGGEDDNLRARLDMAGIRKYFIEEAILVHREKNEIVSNRKDFDKSKHKDRPDRSISYIIKPKNYFKESFYPENIIENTDNWGTEFNKIIYNWNDNEYSKELCINYLSDFLEYDIYDNYVFDNDYKIIALVQVYNETDRLRKFFHNIESYCDGIILLDDGSTDDTYENANSKKILLKVKKKRKIFNDLENRNILLNIASFFRSKWYYFIDADEMFDSRFENVFNLTNKDNVDIVSFKLIHKWDSEENYRIDYPYSENGIQKKYRMFKNIGRTQIISDRKLHFQPVPYYGNIYDSNILILHSGLQMNENRIKKFNYYTKIDKERAQKSYSHLVDKKVKIDLIKNINM
jgi:hypothetical protein